MQLGCDGLQLIVESARLVLEMPHLHGNMLDMGIPAERDPYQANLQDFDLYSRHLNVEKPGQASLVFKTQIRAILNAEI